MDSLLIEGGNRLEGKLDIPRSKNASLPLLCLSLLTDKKLCYRSVPDVADIRSLESLLASLGVQKLAPGEYHAKEIKSVKADYELVRKMRASVLVLGPLLARTGEAIVSLPGGCAIGERPIDIHLDGLKKMGAEIQLEAGYVHAKAKRLVGTDIDLHFPSVTGTINLMCAASLADGKTILEGAAREPEVQEVAHALNKMGAKITGEGSTRIEIEGVRSLSGLEWEMPADRIQFITYLAAAAITHGDLECSPIAASQIESVLDSFRQMGCEVETNERQKSVRLISRKAFKPIDIETAPFPGFPTDAQAQLMACLSLADPESGLSHIEENIFENRFQHVSELRRMGADIHVKGNLAAIKGVPKLSGATVMASDLRASASLVLAGLAAEGETKVLRVYHLDRGYERLEERLQSVGARLRRVPQ